MHINCWYLKIKLLSFKSQNTLITLDRKNLNIEQKYFFMYNAVSQFILYSYVLSKLLYFITNKCGTII